MLFAGNDVEGVGINPKFYTRNWLKYWLFIYLARIAFAGYLATG